MNRGWIRGVAGSTSGTPLSSPCGCKPGSVAGDAGFHLVDHLSLVDGDNLATLDHGSAIDDNRVNIGRIDRVDHSREGAIERLDVGAAAGR